MNPVAVLDRFNGDSTIDLTLVAARRLAHSIREWLQKTCDFGKNWVVLVFWGRPSDNFNSFTWDDYDYNISQPLKELEAAYFQRLTRPLVR